MRRGLRLLAAVFSLLLSPQTPAWEAKPFTLQTGFEPGSLHMGVRFMGALELPAGRFGGIRMVELSGLAYDADEDIVYALSDQGALFHLQLRLRDGLLAGVDVVAAHALRDEAGEPLSGRSADAEGLAALNVRNGKSGDARLLVSFERQTRVAEYSTDGRLLRLLPLPDSIAGARFASSNRGLEALAADATGKLYVAPERPLLDDDVATLPLLALDGQRFDYPLTSASVAVVGMDFMRDGSLLVLERDLDLLMFRLSIRLRLVDQLRTDDRATPLTVRDLAVFDSPGGWRVDNFEGLTRLQGDRILMVSDDNQSLMQRTLLVLLERVPGRTGRSPKFERVQGRQN